MGFSHSFKLNGAMGKTGAPGHSVTPGLQSQFGGGQYDSVVGHGA